MESQTFQIYASQRDAEMQRRGAVYKGRNVNGALVYVAPVSGGGTITYVVTDVGAGRLAVRAISACAC